MSDKWYLTSGGKPSELFAREVRLIREDFRLTKTNTVGHEVSTGIWRSMQFSRNGKTVYVNVNKFDWRLGGSQHTFYSCAFDFNVEMAVMSNSGGKQNTFDSSGRTTVVSLSKIWKYNIQMLFPDNYLAPESKPPMFRVLDDRYVNNIDSAHAHHVLSGGVLCMFGNTGDWNPARSNSLTAFYTMLDHIYSHYTTYGW